MPAPVVVPTKTFEILNLPQYHTRHHNGRRFRNIWGPHADSDAARFDAESSDIRHRALDVASWLFRKGIGGTKEGKLPSVITLTKQELAEPGDLPRAVWLGHAAVLIQQDGLNIITDPVFGERVSPVKFAGPRRLCGRAAETADLPRIDAVVLSHNHYDHAEADTLKFIALRGNPEVFVPLRVAPLMRSLGVKRVHELDWWQAAQTEAYTVTCLPAKHFSGRTATDRNETLWASFMISLRASNKHIYFAGDTAYSPHFTEIADVFANIDLTLMPIGAYLPRWFMREVHVSPDEAVQAFKDLKAAKMLGIHWGTYDLADENLDQPKIETIEAAKRLSIDLNQIHVTDIGAHFTF